MAQTDPHQPSKALVPVPELAVGMHVCELDRPWLELRF